MTINSPAAILLAFYLCVGEEQGVARSELRGTIQTDILKEYIAQKEYIFPPEPSMRLVTDMVEFCSREMPLWHPISISGYHIRERARRRRRSWRSRWRTGSRMWSGRSSVGWMWTISRRGCRSSSMRIWISSRRSRSTGGQEDLGDADAGQVRREEPEVVVDAVPHADGGCVVTAQQPR